MAPVEAADTTALRREIDRIVYELYGLTEEEIAIVKERMKFYNYGSSGSCMLVPGVFLPVLGRLINCISVVDFD